jgi:hypothetical protein
MPRSVRRLMPRLLVLALAAGVAGACTEDVDSSAACPALCPKETVALRDTTLDIVRVDTVGGRVDTTFVVSIDSTLAPFPARGSEPLLLVSNRGAELDARTVVRFDSLVRTFDRSSTETGVAITSLVGAGVRFSVDTAGSTLTAPFTVNVYDVDTPDADPGDAQLLPLFTAERLLGSRTFAAKADVKDSLKVGLDAARIAAKLSAGQRIRLGVQLTSNAPTTLRLVASGATASNSDPMLSYDPTDTTDAVKAIVIAPRSSAPADVPSVAANLSDYTVVASAPPALERDALVVGGIPARRTYLRFAIPAALLDSTTVVRATLLLTQRPSSGPDPTAAVTVSSGVVIASGDVRDIGRATSVATNVLSTGGGTFQLPTLDAKPGESGVREFDIASVVRYYWKTSLVHDNPRALVLRLNNEGVVPGELRFYSNEAVDRAVRPRLKLTYIPRTEFGVP